MGSFQGLHLMECATAAHSPNLGTFSHMKEAAV